MNKIVVVAIIVLTIGGLVWYFQTETVPESTKDNDQSVTSNDEQKPESIIHTLPPTGTNDAPRTGFAKLGENAIYVAEQQPGNKIVVNNINIVPKGYVVIHESKESVPGKVIGYAALEKGAQVTNVTVTLDRSVTDGEELIAMLHADNDDNNFDASTDTPVLDTLGNPLYMIFYVSAEASDPSGVEVLF